MCLLFPSPLVLLVTFTSAFFSFFSFPDFHIVFCFFSRSLLPTYHQYHTCKHVLPVFGAFSPYKLMYRRRKQLCLNVSVRTTREKRRKKNNALSTYLLLQYVLVSDGDEKLKDVVLPKYKSFYRRALEKTRLKLSVSNQSSSPHERFSAAITASISVVVQRHPDNHGPVKTSPLAPFSLGREGKFDNCLFESDQGKRKGCSRSILGA